MISDMDERFYDVRRLETDIVVVGGSGAAVSAAVSASRNGLRVLLVSKGKIGRSGNIIVSTANIGMDGESAYALGERRADRGLTREVLFEKIIESSFYLADPGLVSYFVEDCGERVGEFLKLGRELGEPFIFVPPAGWVTTGSSIGRIVLRMLKLAPGIDTLEDTMVIDLLFGRGSDGAKRVAGVVAFEIKSGRLFIIGARAVVIASGGYQPYSFRCTTSDATGDGIAMALRAGAGISDMEFQLFLPGVMRYPARHRGSIFPFLWYVGGFARPDIVNSHGDSVVKGMDPHLFEISLSTKWFKLIHTYYWGRENGEIFFDFKSVGKFRYALSVIRERVMLKMLYGKPWVYQGEDFKDLHRMVKNGIPWAVGLSSEYSMGGIVVDERLQSELDGLFAVGEAASGLFGAFRGENGLTEMLVMGYRGGEYAAKYARGLGYVPIDEEYLREVIDRMLLPFESGRRKNKGERSNVFDLRDKLEMMADSGFGFLREEKTIDRALRELDVWEDEFGRVSFSKNSLYGYNPEFFEYLELRNLYLCLRAGLASASLRRESRGMHIRRDYPEVDHDNWLKRIVVNLLDKRFIYETLDIRELYKKLNIPISNLPTGRDRNVLDYIERRG